MYNREPVKQISHVMKYHTTIKNHITKVHHIISKKRRRQNNIYQTYIQTKWYPSVYLCPSIPGSPPHPTPHTPVMWVVSEKEAEEVTLT